MLCLKVLETRAAKSTDADYIQIEQNKGCHSHVGKQGGAQEVSIGLGCEHVGLVTHELMHAAGFYHEHERIDRDTFVTVHLANIMEEDARNFQIYESHDASGLKAPYDLCSIMHYGPNISSMNNKSTITVNEEYGQSNCTIGQRKGFSEIDIKKINTLYKCNGYPQTGGVSSVCIDIWDKDECEDMEVDCTSDFMQETLKENCPVTCNHCPKEPTITKAKFVEKEINPNCPTWACDGRCTSKEYKSILELQCPYSCKNDIDKEDQNESCVGWAKIKGYCRKYRHFMNAECAKTCAIAAECPNGVIAKTQTIQSPIKTASPCRDINKYCKTYKENGWCSDTQGVWYMLMQRDCSKTCRFCADSKTTTIKPTTTTQLCKDNNEYCKTYKANGWCTDTEGEWYAFMQNDCAATCLLCMTPSTPSPTSLAMTAKTKVCQDKNKYCKTYNGNGWCTDTEGEWYAFMQKDCAKTCSFCT